MQDNDTPAPKISAQIVSIPCAPRPSNKDRVLAFLKSLTQEVEEGKRPISDIVMCCHEQTEFDTRIYVLNTPRLNTMEVIGTLQSCTTFVSLDHEYGGEDCDGDGAA